MRFKSYVMHNLCKNEIIESVPIFMATAVAPLPPGPFYIKIEHFLFSNFSMYIEQNLVAFVPTLVAKWLKNKVSPVCWM